MQIAATLIYASTAYAPPNVTSAAFEKNAPCSDSTGGAHDADVIRTSGTIQTASPTTSAVTARRALGCVCGGIGASSRSATSASSPSAGAGVEPSSPTRRP